MGWYSQLGIFAARCARELEGTWNMELGRAEVENQLQGTYGHTNNVDGRFGRREGETGILQPATTRGKPGCSAYIERHNV